MTISKIINKTKAISIDWQLSNVCNFDCPYCVDSSKNGKSGWPDFDSCIEVVDTFTEYGLCEFSFSGGELTMWKNLPELFDYIKSKNHKIHLITNGYKAGRYWSKINADIITFSWHPSSNIDVLKWTDNVNLCHIQKRVWVLAYPKLWTKVVVDFNNLKNNLTDVRILELKYVDNRSENISYTEDQLNFIQKNYLRKKQVGKHFLLDDGIERQLSVPDLLSKGLNNFKGWNCNGGVNNFVLKPDGNVYPTSACSVGSSMGNWHQNDFKRRSKPLLCDVDFCWCGPDIKIEKWK
tara:strand:- start:940 stop:1818 length:879 start_codon:yes stop_codon:yes gene_type:complete